MASRAGHVVLEAAACLSHLRLQPGDAVLVTGSAVLPFRVASNDIDLMVITPHRDQVEFYSRRRDPERRSEQLANGYVMTYQDVGERQLDLEVWPLRRVCRAVHDLGAGVVPIYAVEADFTRVGGLEVRVGTDLFHALWSGVMLTGADLVEDLHATIDWTAFFSRRREQHLINVRDAAKGVRASVRAGEIEEAYLKLTWAADNVIDALIFHAGFSINRWKWRLRYLDLLSRNGAIDPRTALWYRSVRFPSQAFSTSTLARNAEFLDHVWETYAGTPPALSPLAPGAAVHRIDTYAATGSA